MATKKTNVNNDNQPETEQPAVDTPEQETPPAEAETENREASLQRELDTANDKYVRLYAEFDNFRRRTSKEREELFQSAGKDVIGDLLTVVDDFERALKMSETATDVEAVREGVLLISQKLNKILEQKGLQAMNAVGQPFDADFHEAITNVPAPSEDKKGIVIDEIEKGYFLKGKVLRYAKVVVGS